MDVGRRVAWALAAAFGVASVAAPAAGQLRAAVVPVSGGASPIYARAGHVVELTVVVRDGRSRSEPLPAGASVRWLRIVPRMQHTETPPPNEGIAQFSNSVLFGPSHGRWIGLDTLEYEEKPLVPSRRVAIDGARVRVSGVPERADGAGSLWIAAEVTLPDGRVARTRGARDVDRLGLSPEVTRIGFRTSDDFLGWLATYFGVPNVFGSTATQADRFVGADCADVLVGAMRASGRRHLEYTSVTGIDRWADAVTPVLRLDRDGRLTDERGAPVELRWGEHVHPGDLVAIDYGAFESELPRAWDHIGALVGDGSRERAADGVLDATDAIRHMAPAGLVDSSLASQGPIRMRVWRWSERARASGGPRARSRRAQ